MAIELKIKWQYLKPVYIAGQSLLVGLCFSCNSKFSVSSEGGSAPDSSEESKEQDGADVSEVISDNDPEEILNPDDGGTTGDEGIKPLDLVISPPTETIFPLDQDITIGVSVQNHQSPVTFNLYYGLNPGCDQGIDNSSWVLAGNDMPIEGEIIWKTNGVPPGNYYYCVEAETETQQERSEGRTPITIYQPSYAIETSIVQPDGVYGIGSILTLQTKFNTPVSVSSGYPAVQLNVRDGLAQAVYKSGSGTDTLTFEYIVLEGDETLRLGLAEKGEQLLLEDASIVDVTLHQPVSKSFPHSNQAGSVATNHDIIIDGVRPSLPNQIISLLPEGKTTQNLKPSWDLATDNQTAVEDLEYKLVYSTANNVSTVTDAEANGLSVGTYTKNINVINVTGLTPLTSYYLNVLVKDSAGNTNVYQMASDTTDGYLVGDGSPGNPFEIATLANLNSIRDNMSASYRVVTNIDASSTINWNDGKGWLPIGNQSVLFGGEIDGQNYSIEGLYINRPLEDYVGLFGHITNASISNVNLEDINFTGSALTGGIVGYAETSNNTIVGSSTSGHLTGGTYSGGFLGRVTGTNTLIEKNSSSVTVSSAGDYVGGFAGNISSTTVTVRYNYATGNVSGSDSYLGGFVGTYNLAVLEGNFATGNVTAGFHSGGFAGTMSNGSIAFNFATGNVKGQSNLGGFSGTSGGLPLTVRSCYASGNVSSIGNRVGGMFGRARAVNFEQSYATGNVTAVGTVGGLAGELTDNSTVLQSFATGNIKGNYSGGIAGVVTSGSVLDRSFATGNTSGFRNGGLIGQAQLGSIWNDSFYRGSAASCIGEDASDSNSATTDSECSYAATGNVTENPTIDFHHAIVPNRKISLSDQASYNLWGKCDFLAQGSTVNLLITDTVNSSTFSTTCDSGSWEVKNMDLTSLSEGPVTAIAEIVQGGCTAGVNCDTKQTSLAKETSFCASNSTTNGDGFATGDGSPGDPWTVCTLNHLNNIKSKLVGGNYHYRLENNLNLDGYVPTAVGVTVSGCDERFCDEFDGNGFHLRNWYYVEPTQTHIGLFGFGWSNSSVKDLGIENIYVLGSNRIGTLFGGTYVTDISNVYATGHVLSLDGYVGGLAGSIGDGTIEDSWTDVHVSNFSTSAYTGGVGGLQNNGNVTTRTYTLGPVLSNGSYTGGLFGSINNTVTSSKSSANIIATDQYAGGLSGWIGAFTLGDKFSDNYTTGHLIEADDLDSSYFGSMYGRNWFSSFDPVEVKNLYTSGNIINNAPTHKNSTFAGIQDEYDLSYVFAVGQIFNYGAANGALVAEKSTTVGTFSQGNFIDYYGGGECIASDEDAGNTTFCTALSGVEDFGSNSIASMQGWEFNDGSGPSVDTWGGFVDGLPVLSWEASAANLPLKPITFFSPSLTNTTITVNWTDQSTNETGYRIDISSDNGVTWTTVANLPEDTQAYTITGLNPSTLYFVRITSINSFGTSGFAAIIELTLP